MISDQLSDGKVRPHEQIQFKRYFEHSWRLQTGRDVQVTARKFEDSVRKTDKFVLTLKICRFHYKYMYEHHEVSVISYDRHRAADCKLRQDLNKI